MNTDTEEAPCFCAYEPTSVMCPRHGVIRPSRKGMGDDFRARLRDGIRMNAERSQDDEEQ